jgi:hypothetical protein
MITLFFEFYVSRKKRRHLIILTLLIGALFYVVSLPTESVFEQRLFALELRNYHTMLLERSLLLIAPVFTAYFAFEHDQSFLKPLIAYFGRLRIGFVKIVFFTCLITLEFILISSFYLVIPIVSTTYAIYDAKTLLFLGHILVEQWILLLLMMTFFKKQSKASVVFMVVFYQAIIALYEGQTMTYYYVLPFYSHILFEQTLTLYYKIFYAIGLGLIHTIKALHEDLR